MALTSHQHLLVQFAKGESNGKAYAFILTLLFFYQVAGCTTPSRCCKIAPVSSWALVSLRTEDP